MSSTARPRSKSTFSFRSNKSDKANGPKQKMDLHETEEEKRKRKFSTKTTANPNLGIVEAQPSTVAEQKSNLGDMRGVQHKDRYGNLITDPDASNPSRSRFERPLDTIRSFEQAIDNGYKRRSEMIRAESADALNSPSRRSSYYGNTYPSPAFVSKPNLQPLANDLTYTPKAHGPSGYSGSRLGSLRQGSFVDNYGPSSSGHMQQQRRNMPRPMNRYSSDYGVYHSQGGYHEPYDNANAGESTGSQSTEPWGNSTDPSSENSSIDRIHALNKLDGGDGSGNGYNNQHSPVHRTIHEEYDQSERRYASQTQQQGPYQNYNRNQPQGPYGAPPSQPQAPQQRQPIKLGGGAPQTSVDQWGPATSAPAARPPIQRKTSEKKSWLKRRFSKN